MDLGFVQVDGSLLSSMFSGRWEGSLDRDSSGRYFLDFEPYCFQQILTFLQCRALMTAHAHEIAAPVIAGDKGAAFRCLVDYLGLGHELSSTVSCTPIMDESCHFTAVSDNAFVSKTMADGHWVDCASVWKDSALGTQHSIGTALSMPNMSAGHIYYAKVARNVSWLDASGTFVGISKATSQSLPQSVDQIRSAYGCGSQTVYTAGVQHYVQFSNGVSDGGPSHRAKSSPLVVQLD